MDDASAVSEGDEDTVDPRRPGYGYDPKIAENGPDGPNWADPGDDDTGIEVPGMYSVVSVVLVTVGDDDPSVDDG